MRDRRLTPANARVAHESLRGKVAAAEYVAGTPACLGVGLADLLARPAGPRDRQLVFGQRLNVLECHEGWAFVQAVADGYCGYLPETAVVPPGADATHWVASRGTHLYAGPKVQAPEILALPAGAELAVLSQSGGWAETAQGFVPACHLRALGDWRADPATVAQEMIHAPYLWGGNSAAGIDCSGLVQMAFRACGIALPGDSDLQAQAGQALAPEAGLRRNDLLFWKGHVALCLSADRMIHATASAMAVIDEETGPAIARIAAAGGGPVTHRRRILG